MANKIVVEIEALDYEVTLRDVEFALKKVYPNIVVRLVASQQKTGGGPCACVTANYMPQVESTLVCKNCGNPRR